MAGPTYENTFGALLVGLLFACFFFGIVNVQVHHYFNHYPEDKNIYKLTVSFLWVLELSHTIGTAHEVYTHTILDLFSAHKPITLPGIFVAVLMGALITLTVQVYLSIRIYRALRKPWGLIGLFIGTVAVARCTGAMFFVVKLFSSDDYRKSIPECANLMTGLLSMSAGIDVTIAITTLYFLFVQRGKASASKVQRLIDALIAVTIRSGLLTSVGAITVLIVFQLTTHTFAWLAIYTCLAKLYTITFLSVLNGREELRQVITNNNDPEGRSILPRRSSTRGSIFTQLPPRPKRNRHGLFRHPTSTEMAKTKGINVDAKVYPPPDPADLLRERSHIQGYAY